MKFMIFRGARQSRSLMKGLDLFPLTPALSPGERVLSTRPLTLSQRKGFVEARTMPLPLPEGEGWGEGERALDAESNELGRLHLTEDRRPPRSRSTLHTLRFTVYHAAFTLVELLV